MNQKDVISLGEKIVMEDVGQYSGLTFWTGAGFLLLILISFLVFMYGLLDGGFLTMLGGAALIIWAFNAAYNSATEPFEKAKEKYEMDILNWKENVAIPYIESLPDEKKEIADIKIETEAVEKINGDFYHGYGTISSDTQHFTPITVTYKDERFITETFWHKKSMEFTGEEKPFITFKKLENDLGHGLNAGNYNTEVFLPEDYEFTKIN